jgi:hypothetical protein
MAGAQNTWKKHITRGRVCVIDCRHVTTAETLCDAQLAFSNCVSLQRQLKYVDMIDTECRCRAPTTDHMSLSHHWTQVPFLQLVILLPGSTLDVVATFTAADLLLRLLGPPGTSLKGPRLAAASRLLSERTTV